MPIIVPPSPEATSLFKYLDYPVSNSTGIPDISILLYQVKSGSLNMPVSISYHAGGRQASDRTGAIGLGWTLNAGGMIARTIHGQPDEMRTFVPSIRRAASINQFVYDDYYYLTDALTSHDTEYDIYSYNFGNTFGKFINDQAKNRILLMPLKPVVVARSGTSFPSQITDENGVIYNFDDYEYYHSPISGWGNVISSRLLTKITSADGQDVITLKYTPFELKNTNETQSYTITDENYMTTSPTNSYSKSVVTTNYNGSDYLVKRLTEIDFKEGVVKFNLVANTDQIQNMQIFNNAGQLLRTINLSMSVMDSPVNIGTTQNFKLDSLQFKSSNSQTIDKYVFQYQPSVQSPNANFRDYWGYYSGTSNSITVPANSIDIAPNYNNPGFTLANPGANRTPSPTGLMIGVLKRIVYPTGGSTEFTFEENLYKYANTPQPGPGLRIAKITTNDNTGNIKIKSYAYGMPDNMGCGDLNSYSIPTYDGARLSQMSTQNRVFTSIHNYGSGGATKSYRIRTFSSEFSPDMAETNNEPIFYSHVIEYDGTVEKNNGKTEYDYTYMTNNGSFHHQSYLSPPGMPSAPNNEIWTPDPNINHYYIDEFNYWRSPSLYSTTVYKNNGNNTYTQVKNVTNNYVNTPTDTLKGLHIYNFVQTDDNQFAALTIKLPVYQYADYSIITGKSELMSSTETISDNTGKPFTTTTNYTYNSHLLTQQQQVSKSNGNIKTSKFQYPFDQASDAVNANMVTKNIISPVIEQNDFTGIDATVPLGGTKTTYRDWGNNIVRPEKLFTKTRGNAYEQRLQYKYDLYGNLKTVSKFGGPSVSYIYGYQQQYPIAEIINADSTQVAFTGFETSETGGWVYNVAGISASGSKTGNNSYTGNISKNGLPAGNYTVSLWAKGGGTISVNGAAQTCTGNWRLYQWNLSGINSVNIITGSNYVDEVRLYPKDAQMSTYTYQPMVGMTSAMDSKNKVTYYNYDTYQRLNTIYDQNGNILKNYNYRLASPSYFNDVQSGTFSKSSCQPDSLTRPVTYTVSAGTYSSPISVADANNKALQDIAMNGPAYASRNGYCYVYQNLEVSGNYRSKVCGSGYAGDVYIYKVPAGKYSSIISFEDAQNKAYADTAANGQTQANLHGTCKPYHLYQSAAVSHTFYKHCSFAYTGSSYYYSLALGKYTSVDSQQDADNQAAQDLYTNGQDKADQLGSCTANAMVSIYIYNNMRNSGGTIQLSDNSGSGSYSFPATSGSISVPSGVYTMNITQPYPNYSYKFTVGSSSQTGPYATFLNVNTGTITSITIGN